jgi:NitT/TauT family transport system ATP-binding protein
MRIALKKNEEGQPVVLGREAGARVKIRAENLGKTFVSEKKKRTSVFGGLNFDFRENDFIALVGPSGCGKSTLLNVIAGLERPTEGTVWIDDKPITKPGADRGMIFQDDAILLWRNVRRNVEYGLELRGVSRAERARIAEKYIELVGLSAFANHFPKELSGGMRKRVAIAAVFANQPEVLLLDEPFGALDYVTKLGLQSELLRI